MVSVEISGSARVFKGRFELHIDRRAASRGRTHDECARKLLALIAEKRAEMNAELDWAAADVMARMHKGGQ